MLYGKLGNVSETSFKMFQADTLHTLCTLLKEIVEERWEHAADTDVKIVVVKSGYTIGGFEQTAQRVSKIEKYIRAESTYVSRV